MINEKTVYIVIRWDCDEETVLFASLNEGKARAVLDKYFPSMESSTMTHYMLPVTLDEEGFYCHM